MDLDLIYKNENEKEGRFEELYEYQEFYLVKENNAFKIILEKSSNNIIIKCRNYEIQFNNRDLSILTKDDFKSIDDSYDFINSIFEENKVFIQEIVNNYFIKLILKIDINQKEKDFEIILLYNYKSEDFKFNDIKYNYNKLLDEVNNLKEKITSCEKKVEKINEFYKTPNSKNKEKEYFSNTILNPYNIKYEKEITDDSYAYSALDKTFSLFKSIEDTLKR